MFNLPNNTPYILIIESDNGHLAMSSRWKSVEGGEMGPQESFRTFTENSEVLEAVEGFLSERPNETD